jgi:hypothetical protein
VLLGRARRERHVHSPIEARQENCFEEEDVGRPIRLVRISTESMKMRTIRRRNWLIKRIVLGFAMAALAAPAGAQARIDPAPITAKTDGTPSANWHQPRRLGGALARGDSQASWSLLPLAEQRSANGFDWGDATVGAGLAFGLVLVGGGTLLVVRRAGREQTA